MRMHPGSIDARDRLIWVKKHKTYGDVLVSYDDEEEYFMEEIDINGDGDVSSDELRIWMLKHDTDGDGEVEEHEL